jgi:2-oxoisovalerate dehydrogenase E2 component (dihydrolipoyl transacylase)
MATITMPQLGETVTEGTVAQWLKTVGDAIEKYEAFVEISTDKVNAEVPSPVTGVLREIIVAAGETVAIGAPIAIIEEVTAVALVAPASEPPHGNGDGAVVPASYGAAGGMTNGNGAHRNGHGGASVHVDTVRRMSPAVRRLAREHKVDVAALRGTGSSGRVTALDVLAATTWPMLARQRPFRSPLRNVQRDRSDARAMPRLCPARSFRFRRRASSSRSA